MVKVVFVVCCSLQRCAASKRMSSSRRFNPVLLVSRGLKDIFVSSSVLGKMLHLHRPHRSCGAYDWNGWELEVGSKATREMSKLKCYNHHFVIHCHRSRPDLQLAASPLSHESSSCTSCHAGSFSTHSVGSPHALERDSSAVAGYLVSRTAIWSLAPNPHPA